MRSYVLMTAALTAYAPTNFIFLRLLMFEYNSFLTKTKETKTTYVAEQS